MSHSEPPAAVVRRVLPASPDVVYDEWLDADAFAEWMCPRPARATKIELDPRIGGRLRIDIDDGGFMLYVTGQYVDLDRPHRLAFTWKSSAWAPSDQDSVVTVTLEPQDDTHTLMTIHHALLPPELIGDHQQGWTRTAEQLDDILQARLPAMSVLPSDYDSDPERFLSSDKYPHDDVHPYVAARLARAGARRVLDVGGGNGRLARLLPGLSMSCLLIDLSPAMLTLAPRPAVRADGSRLPVADACVDAVAALYTLYHYADPRAPIREARRVLRPGGLLAACAPNRDSNPELAGVLPHWGARTTFDGEDAPAILTSVFSAPGDQVEVERWDGHLNILSAVGHAAAFLRINGMSDAEAAAAASTLDLPLTLTMRGCFVYATKTL